VHHRLPVLFDDGLTHRDAVAAGNGYWAVSGSGRREKQPEEHRMKSKRLVFLIPLAVILTVLMIFLVLGNLAGGGGMG
jgi:hypothetical protein